GQGFAEGLHSLVVSRLDPVTGAVDVNLREPLLRRFPRFRDVPVTAYTAQDSQYVFSSVVLTQEAAV
ncbi:MAG: hypothetical protein ABUS49_09770, partial [Acidobacteriota bacterium]